VKACKSAPTKGCGSSVTTDLIVRIRMILRAKLKPVKRPPGRIRVAAE
jgi:hypothetical protein